MKVSINTAVFLHDIEAGESQYECLKRLIGKQIDNIEVRGEMFQGETKDEELKRINLLCADNDWNFFYSIPEQLFENNHINQNFQSYIAMAEKYHIDQLKISLGDFENITAQQLADLKELLGNTSVKVTIENQPNDNGIIQPFKKAINTLRNAQVPLGYTFDSGNWYWIYETPSDAFNNVSDYVTVYHLKDIKNQQTVMLDHGATDWRSMVKKLNSNIPIFLEYDIPNDELNNQIDTVNDVINETVAEP